MKKLLSIIFIFALLLPAASLAQVEIDFGDPIPIPSHPDFGCGALSRFFNVCGPAGQDSISGLVLSIINILLAIVGLIAVLFIIIGGFRYVTAAGNEETAEAAKKTILHAVIGIIVVILSFVIVRVIVNALI